MPLLSPGAPASESGFKIEIPVYSQAPAFIARLCAAEIREELLHARDLPWKGGEKRQREYAERTAGKVVRQAEFRLKDRVISRLQWRLTGVRRLSDEIPEQGKGKTHNQRMLDAFLRLAVNSLKIVVKSTDTHLRSQDARVNYGFK